MTEQHKKTGSVSIAAALLIMGGSNVYQGREGVQETRELRADIGAMRQEVQGMATAVTLLKWRVTNLEGVRSNGDQDQGT